VKILFLRLPRLSLFSSMEWEETMTAALTREREISERENDNGKKNGGDPRCTSIRVEQSDSTSAG